MGLQNVEPHDWSQVVRTTSVTIDRAGIPVLADLAEKIGIHLGKEEIVQDEPGTAISAACCSALQRPTTCS